ncbi:MAG: hypothetical protein CHACPFDD_02943 [Phycisphaerae bacterium]|nr:hypothetical protein [Phycisphaerae bacterium]
MRPEHAEFDPVATPALLAADSLTTFGWIAAAVVLSVAGGYVVAWMRRWMRAAEPAATFTLHDLRAMRADGRISEAEYEVLRRGVIRSASVDAPGPDSGGLEEGGSRRDAGGA